jgi:hypothetical protein
MPASPRLIHDCSMEARITTAGRVHLRPPAALASGRMWLHRSHRVHNAGEVSLMQIAGLAARQDLGKAVLAARQGYSQAIDMNASAYSQAIDMDASACFLRRTGVSRPRSAEPKLPKRKPELVETKAAAA